jgi:hypothetical protein
MGDRLVDPDQPDLLADDRDLEHLLRQNHLRVVPSACRHAIFAALDAFERDVNPAGFQRISRVSMRDLVSKPLRSTF